MNAHAEKRERVRKDDKACKLCKNTEESERLPGGVERNAKTGSGVVLEFSFVLEMILVLFYYFSLPCSQSVPIFLIIIIFFC